MRRLRLRRAMVFAAVAYHGSRLVEGDGLVSKLLWVTSGVLVVMMLHEAHLNVAYTDAVKWVPFVVVTCGVIGWQTFTGMWGLQEAMGVVYATVCLSVKSRSGRWGGR